MSAAIFTRGMPEQDGAPGDMFKGFGFTALICFIGVYTIVIGIQMIFLAVSYTHLTLPTNSRV